MWIYEARGLLAFESQFQMSYTTTNSCDGVDQLENGKHLLIFPLRLREIHPWDLLLSVRLQALGMDWINWIIAGNSSWIRDIRGVLYIKTTGEFVVGLQRCHCNSWWGYNPLWNHLCCKPLWMYVSPPFQELFVGYVLSSLNPNAALYQIHCVRCQCVSAQKFSAFIVLRMESDSDSGFPVLQ